MHIYRPTGPGRRLRWGCGSRAGVPAHGVETGGARAPLGRIRHLQPLARVESSPRDRRARSRLPAPGLRGCMSARPAAAESRRRLHRPNITLRRLRGAGPERRRPGGWGSRWPRWPRLPAGVHRPRPRGGAAAESPGAGCLFWVGPAPPSASRQWGACARRPCACERACACAHVCAPPATHSGASARPPSARGVPAPGGPRDGRASAQGARLPGGTREGAEQQVLGSTRGARRKRAPLNLVPTEVRSRRRRPGTRRSDLPGAPVCPFVEFLFEI